jgi:hypothetical protein
VLLYLGKIVWWFEDLAKYLNDNYAEGIDILKDPSRVYNADESGFPQDPKSGKILAPRGSKNVYSTCSSDKSQITVLACMSATAHYLPPMLVFPGERFRGYNPLEGFTEAVLGRTKSGWMDSELFYTWVRDHFITAISERSIKRPVILFVDGHTSHINLELAELCKSENIILYCLLEHASHILQPCDVALFSPLKKHWRDAVRDYQCKNPGEFVSKTTFASVFKTAWTNGATVDVAVKGFRYTGLFPFSVESVDKNKVEPSTVFTSSKYPSKDDKAETSEKHPVSNEPEDIDIVIADIAETEIAAMPDDSQETVSSQPEVTQLTVDEGVVDILESTYYPPCLYPEIIITNACGSSPKQQHDKINTSPFELLPVMPSQHKTVRKRKRHVTLPKAVSGTEMIRILEERKQQKEREEELKEQRKLEREMKRKLKEEENVKKAEQRKEKKRKIEEKRKTQQKTKRSK